jgi:hypothetical protein
MGQVHASTIKVEIERMKRIELILNGITGASEMPEVGKNLSGLPIA